MKLLTDYKTTIPALVAILGLVTCLGLLATRIISAGDFAVAMASITAFCTFLIGLGAKDSTHT